MNEKFVGDEIRIESGSEAVLRPLLEAAITAFARAAGGEPGQPSELDDATRQGLDTAARAPSGTLRLRLASAGVEVRQGAAAQDDPLLTWSA